MMTVYQLRRKRDGKYLSSKGAHGPKFTSRGRVFTTKSAVKNHFTQGDSKRGYPAPEEMEVITCELHEVAVVNAEDFE